MQDLEEVKWNKLYGRLEGFVTWMLVMIRWICEAQRRQHGLGGEGADDDNGLEHPYRYKGDEEEVENVHDSMGKKDLLDFFGLLRRGIETGNWDCGNLLPFLLTHGN